MLKSRFSFVISLNLFNFPLHRTGCLSSPRLGKPLLSAFMIEFKLLIFNSSHLALLRRPNRTSGSSASFRALATLLPAWPSSQAYNRLNSDCHTCKRFNSSNLYTLHCGSFV